MPFWDRFVLWLSLGLADTLPLGRDAVGRLFDRAFALGRLDPAALNDLSILLLAAGGRHSAPVREAALAELTSRNLAADPEYVRRLLDLLQGPRLTEVLEINRPHQTIPAQLVANVLTTPPGHEVWSNLREFVSQMRFLEADGVQRTVEVNRLMFEAVQLYQRFPVGTVDFLSLLYRHALGYLGGPWELPRALPVELPPWFLSLSQEEQTFLHRCWTGLSRHERTILLLQFYGRLPAEQIAGALRFADETMTADEVARALEGCWTKVLW